MQMIIRQNTARKSVKGQNQEWRVADTNRRVDREASEDSPSALFLRFWLADQAERHRELLLNIVAAGRVGLAPVLIRR